MERDDGLAAAGASNDDVRAPLTHPTAPSTLDCPKDLPADHVSMLLDRPAESSAAVKVALWLSGTARTFGSSRRARVLDRSHFALQARFAARIADMEGIGFGEACRLRTAFYASVRDNQSRTTSIPISPTGG